MLANLEADPFGAAMIAAWSVVLLAALLLPVRVLRRSAGWSMGAGLIGFLVAALLGTAERVEATAAPRTAALEGDAPVVAEPPAPAPAETTLTAGAPPERATPARPSPREVRELLRAVERLPAQRERCVDPEAVGALWTELRRVAEHRRGRDVQAAVRRLEKCRRRAGWATRYTVHRDRVAARESFGAGLRERLAGEGLKVVSSVDGMKHERLRIGLLQPGDEATVRRRIVDPLAAELRALGFEQIIVWEANSLWKFALEPEPEQALVDRALARYGLAQPLELRTPS